MTDSCLELTVGNFVGYNKIISSKEIVKKKKKREETIIMQLVWISTIDKNIPFLQSKGQLGIIYAKRLIIFWTTNQNLTRYYIIYIYHKPIYPDSIPYILACLVV